MTPLKTTDKIMSTLQIVKDYFEDTNRDIANWKFNRLSRNRILVDGEVFTVKSNFVTGYRVLKNLPGGKFLTVE